MSLILLLFILVIFALDRVLSKLSNDSLPWYLNTAVWLLLPWAICALAFALPIIVHRERLEYVHVSYIALCLLCCVCGSWIGYFKKNKINYYLKSETDSAPKINIGIIAALGIVGQAASIYDNIATTGISFGDRLFGSGLNAARELNFSMQQQQIVGPFHLLEILSGLSIIYLIYYINFIIFKPTLQANKKFHPLIAGFTFLLILINSLLISGGRIGLILLIMILFMVILFDKDKSMLKIFWHYSQMKKIALIVFFSTFIVALAGYMATAYVEKRSNQSLPLASLNLAHRADIVPAVFFYTKDISSLRYGIFTLSYLTTPLATFALYFDLPSKSMPGPFFGQYNFPGVADRIVKRIDISSFRLWWDARLELFQPLTRDGYGGNVWPTILRDIAADVGWGLVPVVMFLIGFASSVISRSAYLTGNPFKIAIASAMLCICAFSAFHSVIYLGSVAGLLFYGAVFLAYPSVSKFLSFKKLMRPRRIN